MEYELAIIGAGPAGYTAAIYAVRAGIKTVVLDKAGGGGLALYSPKVENYPGFAEISGMDLMEKMKQHAEKYADINLLEEVTEVITQENLFSIKTGNTTYSTKAVLLCMGTEYRKLGVAGEQEFQGRGVSYCATCDGNFFVGKNVAVVGGGNSAVIEAIYLKQVGVKDVSIIHRRDQLRAEKAYEQEALKKGVKIVYHTHIESIHGAEKVTHMLCHNVKTNKKDKIPIDGLFISIGEEPQNALAKQMGVHLDDHGYIRVDDQQRTNIRGVYAAGDITGGLRQIVTACAEGAIAALATTEVLGKAYPY